MHLPFFYEFNPSFEEWICNGVKIMTFRFFCSWRVWREDSGPKTKMEPKTRTNPHTGSHLQLWNGESSKRRNKKDKNSIARVWPSWRRQRLLLVPKPQIPKQTQTPSPPKLKKQTNPTNPIHFIFFLIICVFREIISRRSSDGYTH